MITNIHLGVDGRLGNQLFQYAALKSLSLHTGNECVLPNLTDRLWHGQSCLLDKFNIDCNYTEDFSSLEYLYEEPEIGVFDENFFSLPNKTTIRGFFQNVKYFEKYSNILKKELTPLPEIYNQAKEIIQQYKNIYPDSELVSLHIRRGDNINVDPDFGNKMFGSGKYLSPDSIWGKYIHQSKKVFNNKNVKYLLFTGGSRDNDDSEDLEWVKTNFNAEDHILASTSDVLLDYSLISLCDHNILCHSTSFGWWAAYINENPNKIMIIPSDYFLGESDATRLINKDFLVI